MVCVKNVKLKNRYIPANMKRVRYVKVIIRTKPVEDYLIEVKHVFMFKGEHFKGCETIEEVRDKFCDDLREDYVIEGIEVYLFNNKKSIYDDKFEEYLGE